MRSEDVSGGGVVAIAVSWRSVLKFLERSKSASGQGGGRSLN